MGCHTCREACFILFTFECTLVAIQVFYWLWLCRQGPLSMLRFTYQKNSLDFRSQEGSQAGQKGKWGMKTLSGLFCLKRISHQSLALSIGMPYHTFYLFLLLYSWCNPHLNLLMLCSPFSFIISIYMGYLWNGFWLSCQQVIDFCDVDFESMKLNILKWNPSTKCLA